MTLMIINNYYNVALGAQGRRDAVGCRFPTDFEPTLLKKIVNNTWIFPLQPIVAADSAFFAATEPPACGHCCGVKETRRNV